MSERRNKLSDAEVELIVAERQAAADAKEAQAELDKWNARKRFVGSALAMALAGWKLTLGGAEGAGEIMWLGVFLAGAGVASWDQVLKALGR